jgi:cyclic beta-1,2-glucan synthetase
MTIDLVLEDPDGVYGRMDFRSRDRYRHAVEEVAEPTGEAQLRVALKAVERARQVAERTPGERSAHIGYYLIGGGRRQFESGIGWVPNLRLRVRRLCFRHATPVYLGTIASEPSLVALALLAAGHGAQGAMLIWLALLAAVPASEDDTDRPADRQQHDSAQAPATARPPVHPGRCGRWSSCRRS